MVEKLGHDGWWIRCKAHLKYRENQSKVSKIFIFKDKKDKGVTDGKNWVTRTCSCEMRKNVAPIFFRSPKQKHQSAPKCLVQSSRRNETTVWKSTVPKQCVTLRSSWNVLPNLIEFPIIFSVSPAENYFLGLKTSVLKLDNQQTSSALEKSLWKNRKVKSSDWNLLKFEK